MALTIITIQEIGSGLIAIIRMFQVLLAGVYGCYILWMLTNLIEVLIPIFKVKYNYAL